jgi:ferrochelatase
MKNKELLRDAGSGGPDGPPSLPIGVLVVNTGSPDAPEPPALRRYLKEFLGDPRVIELNAALRWLLLRGVILPLRSRSSAELYRRVWTPDGAPLLVVSRRQAALLQEALGEGFRVVSAMRYGEPSIARAIRDLVAEGCERLVLFPAFPQYAMATTGSVYAETYRCLASMRSMPSLAVVPPYFDHPAYVNALSEGMRPVLEEYRPDHIVLSFHGIPLAAAEAGDPYPSHCERTARLLADSLDLPPERWTQTYQSRFGRQPWLQPYTDVFLRELAGRAKRVLVACPGFTVDCLETVDEIGEEARDDFLAAGGEGLRLVPCLNESPSWIAGMRDLVLATAPRP